MHTRHACCSIRAFTPLSAMPPALRGTLQPCASSVFALSKSCVLPEVGNLSFASPNSGRSSPYSESPFPDFFCLLQKFVRAPSGRPAFLLPWLFSVQLDRSVFLPSPVFSAHRRVPFLLSIAPPRAPVPSHSRYSRFCTSALCSLLRATIVLHDVTCDLLYHPPIPLMGTFPFSAALGTATRRTSWASIPRGFPLRTGVSRSAFASRLTVDATRGRLARSYYSDRGTWRSRGRGKLRPRHSVGCGQLSIIAAPMLDAFRPELYVVSAPVPSTGLWGFFLWSESNLPSEFPDAGDFPRL